MSWMQKLYLTYEEAVRQDQTLLPIAHVSETIHIRIVIDGQGNFKRANIMDNEPKKYVPATEKSKTGRTGKKPATHPLSDKLRYVAKDYPSLGGKKASFFREYSEELKKWCESEHTHPRAQAIYAYVTKGQVVQDLMDKNILPKNKAAIYYYIGNEAVSRYLIMGNTLPKNKKYKLPIFKKTDVVKAFKSLADSKTKLVDFGDAFIGWSVELNEEDTTPDTWADKTLQNKWIDFISDQSGIKGFCYVTGELTKLANKHPAKIHPIKSNAKLISSNDWEGFTFLGRFTDDKKSAAEFGLQALGIGLVTTQKAHAALAWLIQERGFQNDTQIFISWAVSGKDLPDPLNESFILSDDEASFNEYEENNTQEIGGFIDHSVDLGESYSIKLRQRMAGYLNHLDENEQIIIMGLDTTSDGRMCIIYYREFFNREFLERLEKWHSEFSWNLYIESNKTDKNQKRSNNPQFSWIPCTPIPKDVALIAYGRLNDKNELTLDGKIKKKVIENLIPCIFEYQQISNDLVQACFRNVIKHSFYNNTLSKTSESRKKKNAWCKSLGIACALYRGYCQRHPEINYRRNYAMALEENRNTRDYLFGRLLAIAERIEDAVLHDEEKNRITKAMLYMPRFSERPCETWQVIYKELQPYLHSLKTGADWRPGFLANRLAEIDNVFALFINDDFTRHGSLSCEFLLGYHCQRHFFKNKTDINDNQTNSGKTDD